MENGTFIFEFLLKQKCMNVVDDLIVNHLINKNNMIDISYIPEFVFLVTTIIKNNYLIITKQLNLKLHNINNDSIEIIMGHFYNYIVTHIKTEFNSEQFFNIYNTCVNLAIMKIKPSSKNNIICLRN